MLPVVKFKRPGQQNCVYDAEMRLSSHQHNFWDLAITVLSKAWGFTSIHLI